MSSYKRDLRARSNASSCEWRALTARSKGSIEKMHMVEAVKNSLYSYRYRCADQNELVLSMFSATEWGLIHDSILGKFTQSNFEYMDFQ